MQQIVQRFNIKLLIIFSISLIVLSFCSADLVSINYGGNEEITATSNNYLYGVFITETSDGGAIIVGTSGSGGSTTRENLGGGGNLTATPKDEKTNDTPEEGDKPKEEPEKTSRKWIKILIIMLLTFLVLFIVWKITKKYFSNNYLLKPHNIFNKKNNYLKNETPNKEIIIVNINKS